MSLRDVIQSSLQQVPTLLGSTWQYRRLTSGPAVAARTYSDWTDVVAHATAELSEQIGEDDHWERRERINVRVSDALAALLPGDQMKDPAGLVWAVLGRQSSGVGSIRYLLERALPTRGEANRKGGV